MYRNTTPSLLITMWQTNIDVIINTFILSLLPCTTPCNYHKIEQILDALPTPGMETKERSKPKEITSQATKKKKKKKKVGFEINRQVVLGISRILFPNDICMVVSIWWKSSESDLLRLFSSRGSFVSSEGFRKRLGYMNSGNPKIIIKTPNIKKPSHQAPTYETLSQYEKKIKP